MNIALITAYFYPYSTGGTERYVYDLGISLQNAGHRVMVICPAKDQADFVHENLRVCAFEEENNPQFEALLSAEKIHIAHFHTLTPAVDTLQMEIAAKAGCRVFFSSHVTGNTCVRGDLLRYGKKPCDGKVRSQTCMACYLNSRGMPLPLAKPAAVATRAIGKPQPLADVVIAKKEQLKKIAGVCDGVFVFSDWQKQTFTLNDIEQTRVIPHPWTAKPDTYADFAGKKPANHIRIGFAGRISPEKGLDVL
ncbi:MAG: glycosyltransferase, partial [Mucilaginibacter polytrichastri]|nr:glycosyltransferase [Mucilaginibacter polytrichastri]